MRGSPGLLRAIHRERSREEIGNANSEPDGFRVAESKGDAGPQDQHFARAEDNQFAGVEYHHRRKQSTRDPIPRNDLRR